MYKMIFALWGVDENLRIPPGLPERTRLELPNRHRPPPPASNLRHPKPPDIGKDPRLTLNSSNLDNHDLEERFDGPRKDFGVRGGNNPRFQQEISNRRGTQQPIHEDRIRIDNNNDRHKRPDKPRLNSELSGQQQGPGNMFRNKPQSADSAYNNNDKDDNLNTKEDLSIHARPKIRFEAPNKEQPINPKSESDNKTVDDNIDTKIIRENNTASDIFNMAGIPQRLFSIDGTPASTMDSLFLEHVADLVASTVSGPLKHTSTAGLSTSDTPINNENPNATEMKTVQDNVNDKVNQLITPLPLKDNPEKMPIKANVTKLQQNENSATMPIMPREMIHETPKNSDRFRNIYKEVLQKSQRSRRPPPKVAPPVDYFDYYYYYDELIPIDRMGDYYLYYDEYPEQRTFDVRPFGLNRGIFFLFNSYSITIRWYVHLT